MDTPTQTVWVTEFFLGRELPRVEEYTAVRVDKNSITATVRGYKKVIRLAAARRLFTERTKLAAYLKGCVERCLDKYQRGIVRLIGLLASSNYEIEVVPTAPWPKHDKIVLD